MDYFLPMLGLGLVTSVHCVFMCGAMVVTYAVKGAEDGSFAERARPHLAYQTAKMVSYVAVGLALGAIGAAFDLAGIRGWVMLLAGLFMMVLGLNMTGRFPLLRRLTLKTPKALTDAVLRNRRKAMQEARQGKVSLATPLTFGLLTGLMPCGPLQAAQLAAAGTGSAAAGATAMLGFGLGTAPLMIAMGVGSGFLGATFKKRMTVAAAIVVIALGLVMFNRGSMLVGSPVTFQSAKQVVLGGPQIEDVEYGRGADGVAEIPLTIENVRFVPDAISIPADEPVRLVVERREDNACSDQIAIPQLGVLEDLKPFDTTVVELPPASAGSYTLTCGMGMMSGRIQVGSGAAAISGSPLVGIGLAGVLLGIVAYALSHKSRSRADEARPARRVGPSEGSRAASGEVARVIGLTYGELALTVAAVLAAIIAGYLLGGAAN
ncbi:MAG: sulfite exporter TauE/SafE family protein [Coriobacteriia bacterium]|nr:sulfite exporter TauE/SafE family protein [Coriobacteriia bacterium]